MQGMTTATKLLHLLLIIFATHLFAKADHETLTHLHLAQVKAVVSDIAYQDWVENTHRLERRTDAASRYRQ